ncbi:dehydrogenase/reductase SDR family member 7B [Fistulifera solaris]|uniref:Dehydrogenase/reductase SDR family member 7B n=1 Tax=Fistulifera solaris TaxID=1519565 RepID=A0A1Z5JT94_FISSO|nr:dehydrogenase/reductase SDR family member 7B [Fistulifera solaris]|eukprot:GAX17253.1 dehydrogenase/reductase SDR family member 7B [Fistulifera solaris]
MTSLRWLVFFIVVPSVYAFAPRSLPSRVTSNLQMATSQQAFAGQTCVITGASSGLGKSLALALAECGASTLILSARSQERLEEVQRECQDRCQSITVHCITADLSQPESVNLLTKQTLAKVASIDLFIHCGGVSSRSRFLDTTLEVDQQLMQINFFSGAALCKAFVPKMPQGSRIIWISSVQGLMGLPNRSSYAASKFAVQGYCESIRAELALDQQISVHCISPGYINTNLSQSAITGSGKTYGITDATTAAGADANDVAKEILTKVAAGSVDFTVAATLSARVAIWLRFLCPALLRYSLLKRYEKSKVKSD